MASSSHEPNRRQKEVGPGSERSFGIVFTIVFAIIAGFPVVMGSGPLRKWAAIASGVLLAISLVLPAVFKPFNFIWHKFGLLLHLIVSPIILGILYYIVLVPLAMLMRLFGKRPLDLELDKESPSYWQIRTPPGPPPETMQNQF